MHISRMASIFAILVVVASGAVALGQAVNVKVVVATREGITSRQFSVSLDGGGETVTKGLSDLTGSREPLDLDDMGTLESLTVSFSEEASTELGFTFRAGDADTVFMVSTGESSFPPITDGEGQVVGTLSLTSIDGGGVVGRHSGTHALVARANGNAVAHLLDPLSRSSFGSESAVDVFAGPIAGTISNIELKFSVDVTANELIAGSGRFEVIPEPASMALVALGGLAMVWRRRLPPSSNGLTVCR